MDPKTVLKSLSRLTPPLLVGLVTLAHPSYTNNVSNELSRITNDRSWLEIHELLLVGFGLLDLSFMSIAKSLPSAWGKMVLVGAALNIVFYSAFIGIDGVSGGLLAQIGSSSTNQTRGLIGYAITDLFASHLTVAIAEIGALGWIIAGIGIFGAWSKNGVAIVPGASMLIGTVTLAFSHAPPFGPAGSLIIFTALVLAIRSRVLRES